MERALLAVASGGTWWGATRTGEALERRGLFEEFEVEPGFMAYRLSEAGRAWVAEYPFSN